MCGRVCSLSRVKGGVERCGVCHACPVVRGRRARCCLCGYWRVVGEGVFPLFLLPLGVPLGWGKRKVAAWGECLVFSFCVGSVVDYGCEVACEW